MRKPTPIIDYSGPEFEFRENDYKIEELSHNTVQNLESVKKWLYLGADITNPNWAKIGITSGDLSTRSYSSANPNYFIFCAFQFNYNVTKEQMEVIETQLLNKFDLMFTYMTGHSLRLRHYESQKLSECYSVNFLYLLDCLHFELFHSYSNYFIIQGHENEAGEDDGATVACIFSPTLSKELQDQHLRRLLQW